MADDAVAVAREAYARRAWGDAFEAYSRASAQAALAADDVERLALAAGLTGHEDACIEGFERLHQLRLDAGETLAAARAAFWAAMRLSSLGEMARGSGWVARAQRLVERDGRDCVECGYLRLPLVYRATASGDFAAARAAAAEAAEIGVRHGDRDLAALGRSFEGRALIRQGRLAEGLQVLDEAMVSVASAELSPLVTGIIYCAVIAACQQSYALDRAREWTQALSGWCEGQPQLVTFAGACMIHRSEILQLGGEWPAALEEVRQASSRLAHSRDARAGDALYQEGELERLRGELEAAEQSYARASERGRDPQPGLALLRLAQGRVDSAAAAMRRALSTTDALQRARFLPAFVEIMLAAGELEEARRAADELGGIADRLGMEVLAAMADHARGAVALADGDARAALQPLRRAQDCLQRVGAPYLCARVRVVMARAFQALGDADGTALEVEAARKVFVSLGAAPDLAAVEALATPAAAAASAAAPAPAQAAPGKGAHGLSPRELEVLLLVAAGKTNKVIARELFVSEKTVDRHVSNIFAKLNVPSRAAATAWAYQHRLLG